MEAEARENSRSEIHSDGEDSYNEVSHEALGLDRESLNSQESINNGTPSILAVHELKKTSGTLDCGNNLLNQEIDSVLKTVRSWISKSQVPTRNVESRQNEGLLDYINQFEKKFFDKETHFFSRKSNH